MQITKDTKLKAIMKEYPWLIDAAIEIDPAFRALRSPMALTRSMICLSANTQ